MRVESTVLTSGECFSLQLSTAVSTLWPLYLFEHLLQVRNNPFPVAELGLYSLRVWSNRLVSGNWMRNLQFSCPTAWSPGRKQWHPSREMPLDMKELTELRWRGDLGQAWGLEMDV